jgi:hypothetical protein
VISAKKKAAGIGRFDIQRLQESYFGGGVVVPPEDFLLFLPPLWVWLFLPLFVVVVVVPLSPAGLSVDPAVACANDRLAPSNSVNAMVSSFFIRLLQRESVFWNPSTLQRIVVQHSKQRSWKKESFLTRGKKSGLREAAWGSDEQQFIWVMGLLPVREPSPRRPS